MNIGAGAAGEDALFTPSRVIDNSRGLLSPEKEVATARSANEVKLCNAPSQGLQLIITRTPLACRHASEKLSRRWD